MRDKVAWTDCLTEDEVKHLKSYVSPTKGIKSRDVVVEELKRLLAYQRGEEDDRCWECELIAKKLGVE